MSSHFVLSGGRTVILRDGFVIGRGSNCDLVLDDGKASRRHAKVIVEGGVVEIEDLGSSNGTFLNDAQVQKRMLRAGDEVRIGTSVLTFREGAPAAEPSAGAAPGGGGSPAASGPVFDDDDELFGGSAAAPPEPVAPAPARAPPEPEPKREPGPAPAAPAPKPAAGSAGEPAAGSAGEPKNVVEFVDEIVEVRSSTPASKPRAPAGSPSADAVVESKPKVLQFSKNVASKNMLGDDVGQMSGGMRALVFVLVIAGMAGIAWGVMTLVQ